MDEDPPERAADVYRALAPAVLGYLRAQRVADPEDTLGEVFLQVARDFHRFKGDGAALRRWVFSIAHNRSMDTHRKRKRDRAIPQASFGELADDAGPLHPEANEPFDPVLVEALGMLSPDQREVVILRFVADLPLEAVAKITGRKAGAVKSLQHRGLENLRKAVSPPS